MRILAIFTFSFALGSFLALFGLPIKILAAIFLILLAALLFCVQFRGRTRTVAFLSALGILVGFLYANNWRREKIDYPRTLVGSERELLAELTDDPKEGEYGFTVQGKAFMDGEAYACTFYLPKTEEMIAPEAGDILKGFGTLSEADDWEDPFSYARSSGRVLFIRLRDCRLQERRGGDFRYFPHRVSRALQRGCVDLLPEDTQGFLIALLTGNRGKLSYAEREDMKLAGNYHAIAISGMHVSILMSFLYLLCLHNRKLYLLLGLPVLLFYSLMTGFAASVVRASFMHLCLMLAPLCKRESDPATAMGASLFLLTLLNPSCLLGTGLYLSYASTAGILLFSPSVRAYLLGFGAKFPRHSLMERIWRSFAASSAASLGALVFTLPISMVFYGRLPLFSLLTNLLTLWAITLIFILGFLCLALYAVFPLFAAVLSRFLQALIRYVQFVSGKIAVLPFGNLYPQGAFSYIWIVFFILLCIFFCLQRKKRRRTLAIAVFSVFILLLSFTELDSWTHYKYPNFTLTALDVGQGQCLLLESDGMTAAIDCGGSYPEEVGNLLADTLCSRGYDGLDFFILTHFDLDHMNGAEQLLHRIAVSTLLIPDIEDSGGNRENLEVLAEKSGVSCSLVRESAALFFGSGRLTLLAPETGEEGNEACLSVLASFDSYDILVTGDLPAAQEEALLRAYDLPDPEIYIAGHHGAKSSSSEKLLKTLRPDIVIISVGENRYGHPAEETLARISSVGAKIYRTDQCGTVIVGR